MQSETPLVLIIGAPRTGTNMLRDILCEPDGVETWPCDEINYIWRHGNRLFPTDELPEKLATNSVKKFIRGKFEDAMSHYNARVLVEKTCANCLRIPFVLKVFPRAKFIFIKRDPVDAIVSAMDRWKSPIDFRYAYKKFKFVPKSDLLVYITRHFFLRSRQILSVDNKLTTWGPVISADAIPKGYERDLMTMVAKQHQRCVALAESSLALIPEDRVNVVKYEELVSNPKMISRKIFNFIDYEVDCQTLSNAVSNITTTNIGKGYQSLRAEELQKLQEILDQWS